ncbi:Palmitoyltransferase zdhhc14 [Kappamyces sp. JEL0680]|nr:Palmitoyltransferase zdhhc14 [Kappamyces sp. JEL0680]
MLPKRSATSAGSQTEGRAAGLSVSSSAAPHNASGTGTAPHTGLHSVVIPVDASPSSNKTAVPPSASHRTGPQPQLQAHPDVASGTSPNLYSTEYAIPAREAPLPSTYPFLPLQSAVDAVQPTDSSSALQLAQPVSSADYIPPHVYTKQLVWNGAIVERKYCTTCNIWRPLRAYHCSDCDACVERQDHHCPWMASCIGKRNYPYFYGFLLTLWSNDAIIASFSIYYLVVRGEIVGIAIALAVFTSLLIWPLSGLAGYHTYLVTTNTTTHEDLKKRRKGERNPFDEGSMAANCRSVLFGPCSKDPVVYSFQDD